MVIGSNRIRILAAAVTGAVIVSTMAVCGGEPTTRFFNALPGTSGDDPGKGGAGLLPVTRQPSAAVETLPDSAPDAVTADVARTLFATAPVVVVANPASPATPAAPGSSAGSAGTAAPASSAAPASPGTSTATTTPTAKAATAAKAAAANPVKEAAAAARGAHAPLLLASSVSPGLAATLRALHPLAVLTVGLPVNNLAARLPGVQVTRSASQLPAAGVPPRPAHVAVLTDDSGSGGAGGEASAAISATAAAAGATAINVNGGDPRTDPRAIESLSGLQPQHVIAAGGEFGTPALLASRLAVAETGRQLPGGGQVMFPGRRLVALYGHPGTASLGALGQQGLSESIARAQRMAREYRSLSGVPVVPTFEIIATVAVGAPGPAGDYSSETPVSELIPWVRRATDHGMYVVLDLQPGRASLLDQAKRYQSLLQQPNVGLALDPEWKLQPGQVPLQQIGHVDIGEVNSVIAWLAGLTAQHHLPQKALVLHQFRPSMITGIGRLDTGHDDLSIVLHMDGQGPPGEKEATWHGVLGGAPRGVFFGWKDFFVKDTPMISPQATMHHDPQPVMISYQ